MINAERFPFWYSLQFSAHSVHFDTFLSILFVLRCDSRHDTHDNRIQMHTIHVGIYFVSAFFVCIMVKRRAKCMNRIRDAAFVFILLSIYMSI